MKKIYTVVLILISISGLGLWSFKHQTSFHNKVVDYMDVHLDALMHISDSMLIASSGRDLNAVKSQFLQARAHYKKIEALVEYFYTESATKLNGPALLESEPSEPGEHKIPKGFQVLEEILFSEAASVFEVRSEVSNIQFYIKRVQAHQEDVLYTPSNVLDALKLNLYRLISKGISGFDSPVALNALPETVSTLEGTQDLLFLMGASGQKVHALIEDAIGFVKAKPVSFNDFNRAVFIAQYINPVTAELVAFHQDNNIPFDNIFPKLIAPEAKNMFDYDKWNVLFFAPSDALPVTAPYIALGKQLFSDKRLSLNMTRSCATCHDPSKAFTDGLPANKTIVGNEPILRNTPTMLNAAYQPAQFYDRRVTFLEDQIHDVVTNKNEMGGKFSALVERLNQDKDLKAAFKEHLGSSEIKERDVKRLIATYIRSLKKLNTPFDSYMQGDPTAMNHNQINGFNLFMGKAKCGTCHFLPLFNGTVPPTFSKVESEVLGVPVSATQNEVDGDLGAYNIYHIAYQKYSFKTPSVRASGQTAPYMHNGIYSTLDEVIDFYDHGGGAGLGIDLEFQTLPPDSLHLSVEEKLQIKAFLEIL